MCLAKTDGSHHFKRVTSCSSRSGKHWAEKVQSFQKRRTCQENRSVVREESGSDAASQERQRHVIPPPVVFQSSRMSRDSNVDDYDGDAVDICTNGQIFAWS